MYTFINICKKNNNNKIPLTLIQKFNVFKEIQTDFMILNKDLWRYS